METIEDIISELRNQGKYNKENVDLDWKAEEVGDLQIRIADRIEEVWQIKLVAEKAKAAAEGYVQGMQSVTGCNRLGDTAKMREALKYLRDASREFHHLILNSKHNEICDKYKYAEVAKISDAIVNANFALAEPLKNYEVGTIEEQAERWLNFCDDVERNECPPTTCRKCPVYWAHMPYKKGDEK